MNNNFVKIPPNFEKKSEPMEEVREEKPRIMSWEVINGCDFVYRSDRMLKCRINNKWKIIYQYAEPDKVTALKSRFRSGEITKEDLINDNYGD